METITTDEAIVRANLGDPQLRGPVWRNGGWFFDLQYTAAAKEALRPVVTTRTELGSLPRPFVPIPAGLACELGLPNRPQDSTATV